MSLNLELCEAAQLQVEGHEATLTESAPRSLMSFQLSICPFACKLYVKRKKKKKWRAVSSTNSTTLQLLFKMKLLNISLGLNY